MMTLACEVLAALAGKTLATAESCTGGGVGQAITAVPGSSAVYRGGIISYTNAVKARLLNVPEMLLASCGAVSAPVAEAMAAGARTALAADVAVSVTGLAGPGGDEFGNPVGTVFVGYAGDNTVVSQRFRFSGDREAVREQAVTAALNLVLEQTALARLSEAIRAKAPELDAILWDTLNRFAGHPFETTKGLRYTYEIRGGEMFVDRKSKSITESSVRMAFHKALDCGGVVTGPKKLGTFGASYLYPVFCHLGIIRGDSR